MVFVAQWLEEKGHTAFVEVDVARKSGATYRDKCFGRFVPVLLEAFGTKSFQSLLLLLLFGWEVQIVNLKGSGEVGKTLGGGNERLERPIVA